MVQTNAPAVVVGRRDGAAVFGSALPCGLRFCPNCGPRIQAQRRQEIGDLVLAARERGWAVYFLTLTLRHTKADALSDLLDGLDVSWRALTRGGFWDRLKARHGLKHYVRVTEEQQGGSHGWHPHYHLLLLCDPAQARELDADRLSASLIAQWAKLVQVAGFEASAAAQKLIDPTDEHLDRMAAYFSKQTATDLAWELTGQATKLTHGKSRNPAQLLAAAVAGDPEAVAAWQELERATKGRRLIAYSAHARDELRVAPTMPSEKAAEAPEPAEYLLRIPREAWNEHAARFGFRDALAAVIAGGATSEELLWWLHARGCRAWLMGAPPRRPPEPPVPGPEGREWLAVPDAAGGFA